METVDLIHSFQAAVFYHLLCAWLRTLFARLEQKSHHFVTRDGLYVLDEFGHEGHKACYMTIMTAHMRFPFDLRAVFEMVVGLQDGQRIHVSSEGHASWLPRRRCSTPQVDVESSRRQLHHLSLLHTKLFQNTFDPTPRFILLETSFRVLM